MAERIRGWAAGVVVLVLFCVAAGMMASFLVPDFSADMKPVFVAGPLRDSHARGSTFIIDGGSANNAAYEFAAGMRLAVFGLLAIGVPLGICAKVVRTGDRWSALDQQWGAVFQIGFLFQLGALVLAAVGLLLMSFDGLRGYTGAPIFSLMLVGDVVVGAMAVPSWRSLQEGRRELALHH